MPTPAHPANSRTIEYPALPGSVQGMEAGTAASAMHTNGIGTGRPLFAPLAPSSEPASVTELEAARSKAALEQQQMETAAQLRQAEERGRELGRASATLESEAERRADLDRVRSLLRALETQAGEYGRLVEREVVALALEIAQRILQHEAQIDPLFLTGAARVALEAITTGGEVRLHVPAVDLAAWQASLGTLAFARKTLVIVGDATMHAGECRCEIAAGVLDLGVRAQMGEVERSFERLLRGREAQRSGSSADQSSSESPQATPAQAAESAIKTDTDTNTKKPATLG